MPMLLVALYFSHPSASFILQSKSFSKVQAVHTFGPQRPSMAIEFFDQRSHLAIHRPQGWKSSPGKPHDCRTEDCFLQTTGKVRG